LWAKDMFYNRSKWSWDEKVYSFKGLPFSIDTNLKRQLVCLYYKSPIILTNPSVRVNYTLSLRLTLDQLKLSLKLLQDFPSLTSHVIALEGLRVSDYPNGQEAITDINILRSVFKNIERAPYGNSRGELRASIYQRYYGVNEWTKYKEYLQEVECYELDKMHYFDIMEQAKALNNGKIKDKYPVNWLTFEQKVKAMYTKHKRFLESQKAFTYSEAIESLEHITADDNKDHDYIVKLPRNYGDILEEGEKMKHCVGGYADGIFNGDRLVMFIRSKKKPDKPLATIDFTWTDKDDLTTYKINQAKGQSNTTLPIEIVAYLVKYMSIKKIQSINEYSVNEAIKTGRVEAYEAEKLARIEALKYAKADANATINLLEIEN